MKYLPSRQRITSGKDRRELRRQREDEEILRRAEEILGGFLGEALTANHPSAIRYAEEALDGIRGVKTLKRIGLRADLRKDSAA